MIEREVDETIPFNEECPFPSDPINLIEEGIYLGDYEGAQNSQVLQSNNIKKVLSLLEDFSDFITFEGIQYKRVEIIDTCKSNLLQFVPECIQFISEAQKNRENILVHCAAGVSRSPSILIAYFMVKYSVNYYAARNYVNKGRPGIYPNQGFISQLLSIHVNEFKNFI